MAAMVLSPVRPKSCARKSHLPAQAARASTDATQHMAREHVLRGSPVSLLRIGRPRHGRPGRGGAQISKHCLDARGTSPEQLHPYLATQCIRHGVAQLRPSPAAWTDFQGSARQGDALLDPSPCRGSPSIGPVAFGRSLLRSPSPSGTRAAARFECASKRQRYVGHDPWAAFCGRRAQTNQCAHLAPRTTCQLSCAGSVAH